jgi:hypothetical protein
MNEPHRVRDQLAALHDQVLLMGSKLDYIVNTLAEERLERQGLAKRVVVLERFSAVASAGGAVALFILWAKVKKSLGLHP